MPKKKISSIIPEWGPKKLASYVYMRDNVPTCTFCHHPMDEHNEDGGCPGMNFDGD